MQELIKTLPTKEELDSKGKPTKGRELTAKEKARAKADKAARPKHLETKRKSEALCKRQLKSWGCSNVEKVRDDRHIRSRDVDFRGDIPLIVDGAVRSVPLRIESKGITLKQGRHCLIGNFPLSNLSDEQKQYLNDNRQRGGLSAIHLAWWFEGKCSVVHIIPWKIWYELVENLKTRALVDSGTFQGKSLRYHKDGDLVGDCAVIKLAGRWVFETGHWLEPLLAKGEQPRLL